MKWKQLSLGMAIILLLVSLAACSKKPQENSSQPNSSQENSSQANSSAENSQATAPELEKVNLIWYTLGDTHDDDKEVFDKASAIVEEKINATLEFGPIAMGEYAQKMQLKAAGNEKFDLCYTSDWLFTYKDNVDKGAFIAIDELIDQYAKETADMIPDTIWNGVKINGKIYGVPNYQVSFRYPALVFLKDVVDELGLQEEIAAIKTMSDLTPIFEKVKANRPDLSMTTIPPDYNKFDYGDMDNYWETVSTVAVDSDLKVVPLDSAEYLERKQADYALAREWYEKEYFPADVSVGGINTSDLTSAGKLFMWEDVYKPGVEADMKTRYGYDVYVQPMGQPVLSTGSITATVTAVSRTSENPERAMMLINLVNTDKELYNLLVFGEEGKHYTKESDTRIKVTSGYSGLAWAIGCQFNAYLVDGQDDDVWEETKRLNGEAKMSHLLGFYFDDTNVKDQIANVGAVEGTFATGGTYGLLPIEEEKEVQAKMTQAKMDAGYQDIMDELQRQLDQWKTQK